jgi:hypothetical protein
VNSKILGAAICPFCRVLSRFLLADSASFAVNWTTAFKVVFAVQSTASLVLLTEARYKTPERERGTYVTQAAQVRNHCQRHDLDQPGFGTRA